MSTTPSTRHLSAHNKYLALLGMVVVCGCGPQGITADWHRIEPPRPAPEFRLPQVDGASVSLADYQGQVVIMEFWATWCRPCRFSLPSLETLYREYRDRGATVLLINQGESVETIERWTEQRYTAPMLLDDGRVSARFGVAGIPWLVVIDQGGRLVYEHRGYGGGLERNLRLIVSELLEHNVG